jgi:hypothetical protein
LGIIGEPFFFQGSKDLDDGKLDSGMVELEWRRKSSRKSEASSRMATIWLTQVVWRRWFW